MRAANVQPVLGRTSRFKAVLPVTGSYAASLFFGGLVALIFRIFGLGIFEPKFGELGTFYFAVVILFILTAVSSIAVALIVAAISACTKFGNVPKPWLIALGIVAAFPV